MKLIARTLIFAQAGQILREAGAVVLDTDEEEVHDQFADYLVKFGRDYTPGSDEYNTRHRAFHRRLEFIEAHNANPQRLWDAGLNHLSDRTDEEYWQLLGWRGIHRGAGGGSSSFMEMEADSSKLASEVDWRKLEMASEVPDQASCGSCWAVATVSMMDAHSELHQTKRKAFSPQQLVNCVPNPRECGGQGGCQGATVELGMAYIERMGLTEDTETPYTAKDGTCGKPLPEEIAASFLQQAYEESGSPHRAARHKHGLSPALAPNHDMTGGAEIGLKSWVTLTSNKARPLMKAVTEGPVAVSVGASDWHSYSNGIFDSCSKDAVIDHAVTLFGYGKEDGKNYWLIRNSWGGRWGEDGYIRLLRMDTPAKDDAYCGTDHDPEKGIECKPYPDAVKVCGMCGVLYDSVAVQFNKSRSINAAGDSSDDPDATDAPCASKL
jgi:cathepsin L